VSETCCAVTHAVTHAVMIMSCSRRPHGQRFEVDRWLPTLWFDHGKPARSSRSWSVRSQSAERPQTSDIARQRPIARVGLNRAIAGPSARAGANQRQPGHGWPALRRRERRFESCRGHQTKCPGSWLRRVGLNRFTASAPALSIAARAACGSTTLPPRPPFAARRPRVAHGRGRQAQGGIGTAPLR
jgi:hypothetical protein